MKTRLLVVGARPNSLGEDIAEQATHHRFFKDGDIDACDVTGHGDRWDAGRPRGHEAVKHPFYTNVESLESVRSAILSMRPTHVACTVGINNFVPDAGNGNTTEEYRGSIASVMNINATGVMALAHEWLAMIMNSETLGADTWTMSERASGFHFAAVSSNSAHIARTNSAPYCMSKAALSMGMRCIARDSARIRLPVALTTYEPGFLSGTPMSLDIVGSQDEFQEARYHRIPSGLAMQPTDLAEVILNGMSSSWNLMNGACIRLDGGEQ